jgi:hypothetical protein
VNEGKMREGGVRCRRVEVSGNVVESGGMVVGSWKRMVYIEISLSQQLIKLMKGALHR